MRDQTADRTTERRRPTAPEGPPSTQRPVTRFRFRAPERPPHREGTTITEERSTTDAPTDPTRDQRRGYEWTCPICGTSRLNRAGDEDDGERHALAALRAHVRSSNDDEHGPANAYPPEYDPNDLAHYVSFTD